MPLTFVSERHGASCSVDRRIVGWSGAASKHLAAPAGSTATPDGPMGAGGFSVEVMASRTERRTSGVLKFPQGASNSALGLSQGIANLLVEAGRHAAQVRHESAQCPGRLRQPIRSQHDERDNADQKQLLWAEIQHDNSLVSSSANGKRLYAELPD